MKAFFTKTVTGLTPADDPAREAIGKLKNGTMVQVEITRPRNIQRHRYYWALCQKLASAVPGNASAENVSDMLKIATGHCKIIKGKKDTYKLPTSIAFSEMPEDDFTKFLDKASLFICEELLGVLKPSSVREELARMLGEI